jgi:hypothetical protein
MKFVDLLREKTKEGERKVLVHMRPSSELPDVHNPEDVKLVSWTGEGRQTKGG